MNERIKLLAEQADKWSAEEYHQLFLANESPNGQKLFREKFAELLIEECKNVCTSGTIEKPMGLYYAKQIEKHFGVE